jgi:hypothetical protein
MLMDEADERDTDLKDKLYRLFFNWKNENGDDLEG